MDSSILSVPTAYNASTLHLRFESRRKSCCTRYRGPGSARSQHLPVSWLFGQLFCPWGLEARRGADRWRRKECHGWGHKGVDGVYGSGFHQTGIAGMFGTALSADRMISVLRYRNGSASGKPRLSAAPQVIPVRPSDAGPHRVCSGHSDGWSPVSCPAKPFTAYTVAGSKLGVYIGACRSAGFRG